MVKFLKLLIFEERSSDAEKSIFKLSNELEKFVSSVNNMIKEMRDKHNSIDNEIMLLKSVITTSPKKLINLIDILSGIQNNVDVIKFTEIGFSYVYNKPYSHYTASSEIDEIKNSCLPTTVLCLGGRDSINDVLLVVACGLCSVVLTKTTKNSPNLHNGAYWYYTPDIAGSKSLGFAPNSTIDQCNSDYYDKCNNQRVSWSLSGIWGGYRLGSLIELDGNTRYYKVILKRDN